MYYINIIYIIYIKREQKCNKCFNLDNDKFLHKTFYSIFS